MTPFGVPVLPDVKSKSAERIRLDGDRLERPQPAPLRRPPGVGVLRPAPAPGPRGLGAVVVRQKDDQRLVQPVQPARRGARSAPASAMTARQPARSSMARAPLRGMVGVQGARSRGRA